MELPNYNFTLTTKPLEEWRELGVELSKIYGKGVWKLFTLVGVNEVKIRDAHKICQSRGITSFPYLLSVVKRLK